MVDWQKYATDFVESCCCAIQLVYRPETTTATEVTASGMQLMNIVFNALTNAFLCQNTWFVLLFCFKFFSAQRKSFQINQNHSQFEKIQFEFAAICMHYTDIHFDTSKSHNKRRARMLTLTQNRVPNRTEPRIWHCYVRVCLSLWCPCVLFVFVLNVLTRRNQVCKMVFFPHK